MNRYEADKARVETIELLQGAVLDFGPSAKFHIAAASPRKHHLTLCGVELRSPSLRIRNIFERHQVDQADICKHCLRAAGQAL